MPKTNSPLGALGNAKDRFHREWNHAGTAPKAVAGPVFIVSAHGLVKHSLRRLAEAHCPDVRAFSTFDELRETFSAVEPRSLLLLEPANDIAISEQAEDVRSHSPHWHLVLLVNDIAEVDMGECIRAGARGCITQETPHEMVGNMLELFSAGNIVWPVNPKVGDGFSRRVTDTIDQRYSTHLVALRERLILLSKREKEVLNLVGQGLGNKRIASQLGISDTTVRLHMRAILRKLGVENRTQIAILAQHAQLKHI